MPPVTECPFLKDENQQVNHGESALANSSLGEISDFLDSKIPGFANLSNRALCHIPEQLRHVENLRVLNLSNNRISDTSGILETELHTLEKLVMNHNSLSRIRKPACIANLKELHVSFNQLRTFPSWLIDDTFYSLEKVILSNNPLFINTPDIPAPSCSLIGRRISFLDLSNTGMNSSHINIFAYLPSLKRLDISNYNKSSKTNSFPEIPKGALPLYLEELIMKDVGLYTVPCVSDLKHLRVLNLSHNLLSYISDTFPSISKLEKLVLSRCSLYFLPKNFGSLKSLVYLDLSHNDISSLPESIDECVNLEHLDLYNNSFYSHPKQLNKLISLKRLDLSQNEFDIPDIVCGNKSYQEMEKALRIEIDQERESGRKTSISSIMDEDYDDNSSTSTYSSENFAMPIQNGEMEEEDWDDEVANCFDPNNMLMIKTTRPELSDDLEHCLRGCPQHILSSSYFFLPAQNRLKEVFYKPLPQRQEYPSILNHFPVVDGQFDDD
ncbi:leucine-rich repeat and death domain-containing protein 1-like isoform X2 [Cimex lectularius]|uniref:Disease resistance R13L4/SHOC-2-like LRR domain-containing protein n=1 Tax=Cimex lectularius TaxID=79782 RepID=A0A8I6S997_CIMLE|nr:leucine-rich repeat and death domain-containing protein 1-like isoform X2 [Cimex lectularius]